MKQLLLLHKNSWIDRNPGFSRALRNNAASKLKLNSNKSFMSRNAVCNLSVAGFFNGFNFKKSALLFDKIFVYDKEANASIANRYIRDYKLNIETQGQFYRNLQELDFLIDNNIIVSYDLGQSKFVNDRWNNLIKTRASLTFSRAENATISINDGAILEIRSGKVDELWDQISRIDATMLGDDLDSEYFPLLRTNKTFQEGQKKEKVIQIILNRIPEPDESTTWEQLIDFRNDADTRLKYLALINWINEISNSSFSVPEITDKYEYLYYDYMKAYQVYKIKSTFAILEIIAGGSIGFFSGNIPLGLNLATNLIKLGTSTISLFTEERSLPGKEIAYIYDIKNTFSKDR